MRRRNVRDIEAFHDARRTRKLQCIGQRLYLRHWIDCARQTAAGKAARRLCRAAQIFNHVAEFGRFFEIHFLRRFAHLPFQRGDHLARVPFEKLTSFGDALAILLGANFTQAHRHLIR